MNVNLQTRKVEPHAARPASAPTSAGKAPAANFSEMLKNAKASVGAAQPAGEAQQGQPAASPAAAL